MVLGKLSVPGHPTNFDNGRAWAIALAVGADGGCLDIFFSRLSFYTPAYSKNSGRALSVTLVRPVRQSVRLYVPLSCPGHNS